MLFTRSQTKKQKSYLGGFSLVELLITIGIVTLVTGAVLTKHSGFTNSTLLKAQAIELSLDIRAAQQYGVSVRSDNANSRYAYGIYFSPSARGEYVLYSDANDNLLYDAGEEVGRRYTFDPRFEIREVCTPDALNTRVCSADRAGSVAFKRPNFDAVIGNTDAAGAAASYGIHGRGWIEFVIGPVDGSTAERSVIVYQTGQIAVY